MGLSCGTCDDIDGADWWWEYPSYEAPLATKRSKKCCSCYAKINIGEVARTVRRYHPSSEFDEMRGIASDEVRMSDWYLCESCGDLAESLAELGFSFDIGTGESLKQQVAEYRKEEAYMRELEAKHGH